MPTESWASAEKDRKQEETGRGRPTALHRRSRRLVPVVFYLAVTLLFLMPLPLHFGQAVIRAKNDVWSHLWWCWWVREALASGHNPYFTDRLFHPFGAPLFLSGMDLVAAVLSMPLQALLGLVPAYNLVVVATTFFGAWAMYLLALETTGSEEGALVAGAVFGFAPLLSQSTNVGQAEWTNIGFLPLTILLLLRLRENLPRATLFAGLSLALAVLTSWYQGLFLLMFTLSYCVVEIGILASCREWAVTRGFVIRLTAAGLLALLLITPVLVPAIRLGSKNSLAEVPREWVALNSASLEDPLLPNALNPFLGNGDVQESCALGYISLALAILGICESRRRGFFWVAIGVAFYLLSLGPFLRIGRRVFDLSWLPYNLLYALPLGRIPRTPVRFLFLVLIAESVLAAWGVVWLLKRVEHLRGRVARSAVTVAPLTLVLMEWLPVPRPLADTRIPPFYASLASGPPGAVLELPRGVVSRAMYWQTAHHRPIVGGYVARHLEQGLKTEALPLVGQLWVGTDEAYRELTDTDILDQRSPLARGVDLLDAYGIRYVVLHRDEMSERDATRQSRILASALPTETVVWDDGKLQARRTPRLPANTRSGVVLGLGSGWYAVEQQARGERPYRWSEGDAQLSLVLLDAQSRNLELRAMAFSYAQPRSLEIRLGEVVVATLSVTPTLQRVAVRLILMPGQNVLTLRSREPPTRAGDGRLLSFGLARVRVEVSTGEGG